MIGVGTTRVMVALAAVAATAVVSTGGTSAAGSNLCTNTSVCIYDDANWVGLLGKRSTSTGWIGVSAGANDQTSSWENDRSTGARWAWHSDHTGCRSMPAHREDNYIAEPDNDELSAWATNGVC